MVSYSFDPTLGPLHHHNEYKYHTAYRSINAFTRTISDVTQSGIDRQMPLTSLHTAQNCGVCVVDATQSRDPNGRSCSSVVQHDSAVFGVEEVSIVRRYADIPAEFLFVFWNESEFIGDCRNGGIEVGIDDLGRSVMVGISLL